MVTEYLVPYVTSNVAAAVILWLAFKAPRVTRALLVALFAWAAVTNARITVSNPSVYLEYGDLTLSTIYRDFIDGWFSRHIQSVLLTIAAGQAIIAALLALPARWRAFGVAGAVTFLLAIAPLGVGSAFPFSLTVSAALIVMHRRLEQLPISLKTRRRAALGAVDGSGGVS